MSSYEEDFQLRQAARRRLPPWLALVMPFTFLVSSFGSTFVLYEAVAAARASLRPELPSLLPTTRGPAQFVFVGLLFLLFVAGACFSIVLSNLFMAAIPPVRKILDDNAKAVPGYSFAEGMAQGRKAVLYVALPAVAAATALAYFA
jgi:hypothetical protein